MSIHGISSISNELANGLTIRDDYSPNGNMPTGISSVAESERSEGREAFSEFVGQTFFGQLMKTMRNSLEESKYFNGGRAEKMFTSQLDQALVEKISEDSAAQFSDPMYDLMMLPNRH